MSVLVANQNEYNTNSSWEMVDGTYDFCFPPYELFLELGESFRCHVAVGVGFELVFAFCHYRV